VELLFALRCRFIMAENRSIWVTKEGSEEDVGDCFEPGSVLCRVLERAKEDVKSHCWTRVGFMEDEVDNNNTLSPRVRPTGTSQCPFLCTSFF
jgi:hypothetical protein